MSQRGQPKRLINRVPFHLFVIKIFRHINIVSLCSRNYFFSFGTKNYCSLHEWQQRIRNAKRCQRQLLWRRIFTYEFYWFFCTRKIAREFESFFSMVVLVHRYRGRRHIFPSMRMRFHVLLLFVRLLLLLRNKRHVIPLAIGFRYSMHNRKRHFSFANDDEKNPKRKKRLRVDFFPISWFLCGDKIISSLWATICKHTFSNMTNRQQKKTAEKNAFYVCFCTWRQNTQGELKTNKQRVNMKLFLVGEQNERTHTVDVWRASAAIVVK